MAFRAMKMIGDGNHQRPFQFGLRTLLMGTTLLGALLAVLCRVGIVWSFAILWLLLLGAAHVAGNVYGSRSRGRRESLTLDEAEGRLKWWVDRIVPVSPMPLGTQLGDRIPLGRSMLFASGTGAVLGGGLGVGTLLSGLWGVSGWAGITLGGGSAAFLGGFLGFLLSSFCKVAGGAWDEARRESPLGKVPSAPKP